MSNTSIQLLALVPGLPALGAGVTLLAGRRSDRWGHLFSTATVAASFLLTATLFWRMLHRTQEDRPITSNLYTWILVDRLSVDFSLRLDQLSVCFALLITGVGLLIHIYSIGYMAEDPERRRFFSYLNLFVAAMLVLVLADNYVLMYAGWEGVGLASYLLIGFWQYKRSAATAAKKAFVVNRVGDMGFVVALMIIFANFGSFRVSDVLTETATAPESTLTALGLMLLLAACAKSAQVPLQSWLGDAMEGPTPVSALIHAATMVTAGVYLIVRSGAIFDHAPTAQTVVLIVGAVTLLFGAIIGCAKDDIKKALAASTMSQIGYMVLAAGLGPAGYIFAIAHLLAHGFFKAGLFLGSGAVMHAMNDETDMRRYGGLRKKLPITFATFGLAYLAIIGIPPLAGFFTKDHIIEAAFGAGGIRGPVLGVVTVLGAGLTAFYMTRVMLMTFYGQPRWPEGSHPHEAPASMTAPMIVLAFGSVASGALLMVGGRFAHWLSPVTGETHHHLPVPVWLISLGVLAVVALGIAVAWRMYRASVPRTAPQGSPLARAARADLYGDRFNEAALMRPGQVLTAALRTVEDRGFTGAERGVALGVGGGSQLLRRAQNGYVRSYALTILSGAVLVVAVTLAVAL
ncbi:NADH-quinone oxidoreductase chain L [Gordonia araii NBRC 100433]|uniref:NADH-quinone oxidoreductase chain L n=1 Tax=Gordonia araii NBRC 100433 TaxID=1073574 RepID=G7GXL0_9ACTN|nr:NADH-quinone oxidoreductase subunit L [Gordonia araii]NNG98226.1 NADH-quinone oxidoreductase subunit L [Gordonia araii NBRC 100433]GAB08335.1 NADH-quinone oxidoreductase chain L [Gordonia araii NBRC 100433]